MSNDAETDAAVPPCESEHGISVPCYEGSNGHPANLSFSNTELGRSMLLLGSTGSGKTTALRSICRGLIEQQAHVPSQKPALIFFDFKGDRETVALLTRWAKSAGRASDVRLLSIDGDLAYNFLGGFGGLNDVQEYVERLLFGCGQTNKHDLFWDEYRSGLLASALALSHVLGEPHDFSTWTSNAAGWLLADVISPQVKNAFTEFDKRVAAMPSEAPGRALAQFVSANLRDWDAGLDHRTRSNVRATLSNVLRPLLDPKAQRLCRSSALGYLSIGDAVTEGQIVIVSISSVLCPSLARLIGRALKADFYKAVFGRGDRPGVHHRLAMLVADEYHLSATIGGTLYDDAMALPLIRSFGAGIVAATQTLANLDHTIGSSARDVLLPNFNTVLFFRTGEQATASWATGLLGTRTEEITTKEKYRDQGGFGSSPWRERSYVRDVVRPIGTLSDLSRLEPGQVYVHRQFDAGSSGPIWLAEER